MFSNFDLSKKRISERISEKINSKAASFDVKKIHKILGIRRHESKALHLTTGKLVSFLTSDDDFLKVIGKGIPKIPEPVSPRTQRLKKLKNLKIEQKMYEKNEKIKTPPEGFERLEKVVEKNEYPSWQGFLTGLESKAVELMLCKYDRSTLTLMNELERFFNVWNSDFWTSFEENGESEYSKQKHIIFDGWPPWRKFRNYSWPTLPELDRHFAVHLTLQTCFWNEFHKKLLFDWNSYFFDKKILNLQILKLEVETFLKSAVKISRDDWPLQVCQILVENAKFWVFLLAEDDKINKFFDSIASLMNSLISKIIQENIQTFVAQLQKFSKTEIRLALFVSDLEIDDRALLKIASEFAKLGEKILRVEHRLYPEMFPNKTFLKPEKFETNEEQNLVVKIENPFLTTIAEFEELKTKMNKTMNDFKLDFQFKTLIQIKKKLSNLKSNLFLIQRKVFTDLLSFDFNPLVENLFEKIQILQNFLELKTNEIIGEESKKITEYYTVCSKKLYGQNVFDQLHNLTTINNFEIPKLKSMFDSIFASCKFLLEEFDLTELTMLRFYQASRASEKLKRLSKLIWSRLQVDRTKIEKSVIEKSSALFYEAEMLERELKLCVKRYKLFKMPNQVKQLSVRFSEMSTALDKLAVEYPILNDQMILLSMEPISIDVPFLAHECRIFAQVSGLHAETIAVEEVYMNTKIQNVDTDEISKKLDDLNEKFGQTNEFLASNSDGFAKETLEQLIPRIETVVKTFSETLPLVKALRAEGIKQRHWEGILAETKMTEEMRENLLVKDLIQMDLTQKTEKCEEISIIAGKELILESTLDSMKQQWNNFPVKNKLVNGQDKFFIPDEVALVLDDQIIKTQMALSSPFSSILAQDLNFWLKNLFSLQRIFNFYQICDSKLVYLEPLFSAEDIAYQMPEEWRIFQSCSIKWQEFHVKLIATKFYIDLVEKDFEKSFESIFEMFKKIQSGFDAYLQKRKLNSPRLHFLSNNELLELLSKAKNPELIESYLPKLFAAITKPDFNNRGEIVAVFAADGERFDFRRPVNVNLAKRHVDKWLLEVEKEMKNTLQNMIKNVVQKCGYNLIDLEKMIQFGFIGQVILIHYRLVLTHEIEDAISKNLLEEFYGKLEAFSLKSKRFQPSNSREKLLLDNLLVDLEETQTIVQSLMDLQVDSIGHWAWLSNFRYYWSADNLFIRIFNVSTLFGYEYLDVTKPFVKTSKIRIIHTRIALFQHQFFSNLLQGPAATGKSESIKEFSRLMGRFCISFNCSAQVSTEKIESLIAGTILSGTTLCLDEFNRLSTSVMTNTINHFVGIYQSMKSGDFHYKMNGLELVVNSMSAFFLSLNPKYVGRNLLPANTSSVAKIIEVSTADLVAIAQEYFLLADFKENKKCSSDLTTILGQCSAIITPMRHYDFHLRTVLAIVKNAIWLKNKELNVNESGATIKAIQNILSPIFSKFDSKMFFKILFSSKTKPKMTNFETEYKTAIVSVCESLKFEPTQKFVDACYSLYLLSRYHCAVILVGKSLTGKSAVIEVVRELLKQKNEIRCEITLISPSLHNLDSFFGKFDTKNLEWIRGVFTQKLVGAIPDGTERWIHVDGVIDSFWVETLNSLLDDNKKLNLGNGETIILNSKIRIIFETDDLSKVASSTISRCRIIFFEDDLIDPSAIANNLDSSIVKFSIQESQKFKFSIATTKLILFRMAELYRLHEAFAKDDIKLGKLLFTVSGMTTLRKSEEFLKSQKIDNQNIFSEFPQAFGQWMDLTTIKEPENYFWRMFLKRVIRSSLMLTIFGESGTGKTKFITDLVSTLDREQ